MYFAGVDLGSTTGKIAVVEDEGGALRLAAFVVRPSGGVPDGLARELLAEASCMVGAAPDDFAGVCATGYGREAVTAATHTVSEISCHGRGAAWLALEARTIVDVGGQDVKVIALDAGGALRDFAMNDKCAAGTGRFFEAMGRILQCSLDELSALALAADEVVPITSTCSVFAESEVIALINQQVARESIAAGIFASIAERIFAMSQRVGLEPAVVLTGGCAKSAGLRRALEERLGVQLYEPPCDPQIIGAVGAALFARDRAQRAAS